MKRAKVLDAEAFKVSDEYRIVLGTRLQRGLRQEIGAIRRAIVRSSG